MEDQLRALRNKLFNLSYNDVRKEAKNCSICARGKKVELIEKILDIEAQKIKENVSNEITSMDAISEVDNKMNEIDLVSEETQKPYEESENKEESLNDTYTVGSPTEEDFISDDNDVEEDGLLIQKKSPEKEVSLMSEDVSLHMDVSINSNNLLFANNEGRENEACGQLLEFESESSEVKINNEEKDSVISSKLDSSIALKGRFEKQHKKLFENMRSISDDSKILQDRAEKNSSVLSERIKQLASPKRINRQKKITQFSSPADPNTLSFKFGNVPVSDYAKVVKPYLPTPSSSRPEKKKSSRRSLTHSTEKKMDVKQMTMSASRAASSRLPIRNVRKATTPVLSVRLEQLATPKGKRISLLEEDYVAKSLGRSVYTPYKGRYGYVDTTKMSDIEFKEHIEAKSK